MFNLEQSIANWRQHMLAAGIETPMPMEELEIHVHEEIERQLKFGLSAQTAFLIAVEKIGQPEIIKREFKKTEGTLMKRIVKIGAGVAGVLMGMALTIPGSVQLRDELVMTNGKLGLWLLGGFLICWSFALFQQILWPKAPKGEFQKAGMTPVQQITKIGAGIVVLLIGLALMMPAAAQARHEGMVEFAGLCYAVFGIALLITGALVTFWPYKKHKA